MKMTKNTPANKDEPATVEQPKPNHTEKIKSQVLARSASRLDCTVSRFPIITTASTG